MLKRLFYSLIAVFVVLLLTVALTVSAFILTPVLFIILMLVDWKNVEEHFSTQCRNYHESVPP